MFRKKTFFAFRFQIANLKRIEQAPLSTRDHFKEKKRKEKKRKEKASRRFLSKFLGDLSFVGREAAPVVSGMASKTVKAKERKKE